MKKVLSILTLALLSFYALADYKIISSKKIVDIPPVAYIEGTCKNLDSSKESGFYKFKLNGNKYETYCLKYGSSWMTMVSHYDNLSGFVSNSTLNSVSSEGYLPRVVWNDMKSSMSQMVLRPITMTNTKEARITLYNMYSSRCQPFVYFDTLSGTRKRAFFHEDVDCIGYGADYTGMEFNTPNNPDKVTAWNGSSVKKFSNQNNYFNISMNVNNAYYSMYDNVYFFVY